MGINRGWTQDELTNDQVNMSHEHHEIHEGCHYFTSYSAILALSATADFLIITGAKQPHMVFKVNTTDLARLFIFEGASVSANGTTMAAFNNNRGSSNESETKLFVAPTILTTGAQIFISHSGAKNNPGVVERDNELMFAPNTKYIARLIADSNNISVSAISSFYEEDATT